MNKTKLKDKFLAIDEHDAIVQNLAESVAVEWLHHYKQLKDHDTKIPVIFRSMAQRKTVRLCVQQERPYYYIDTGYLGNMEKRKDWHRVVNSGMQHSEINWTVPADRFERLAENKEYLPFKGWRKHGGPILLVTPSDKPCLFYGINRDEWLEETLTELKKHTDRKIIVRDKVMRRARIGDGSLYNQLEHENVHAVVTYNSIAATESIGFGVPAFTLAPNAADYFCEKDLSKIESPKYAEPDEVRQWQHWLAYCQYTPFELSDGTAFRLIKEYNLK